VRLLLAKHQVTVLTIIQLCFAEEESEEPRVCYVRNGQLARVAGSSIAQEEVRSNDSFCPRRSVAGSSGT
jgi:hypothetical protein